MRMQCIVSAAAAVLLGVSALLAPVSAQTGVTITAGAVGSSSTTIWPVYIGIRKGFFDSVGIKVDPVYAQSSTAIAQQVAAGSINLPSAAVLSIQFGRSKKARRLRSGASICRRLPTR